MFKDLLVPQDVDTVLALWNQLVTNRQPATCEFRFKYVHKDLTEEEKELGGQWASFFPRECRLLWLLTSHTRYLQVAYLS